MKRLSFLAGAVLCCALLTAPAKADPISLGVWYISRFGGPGSSGGLPDAGVLALLAGSRYRRFRRGKTTISQG